MCAAVQDLIHGAEPEVIEGYLRGVTEKDPSADEVDTLTFETLLAAHIHFEILRDIFGINGRQPAAPVESHIPHARQLAAVADAVRASVGLRRYVVQEEHDQWCQWDVETLSINFEASETFRAMKL